MTYNFCFFDADDTLFDFYQSAEVSFHKTLQKSGIYVEDERIFKTFAEVSRELWKAFERGQIIKSLIRTRRFEKTFAEHRIDLCPKATSETYLSELCENVHLMPRAVETVAQLKAQGKTVGIITNGVGEVQFARIKRTPLEKLIDFMIVAEDDLKPKPHADMFDQAFLKANQPNKRECVMIGDSLGSDIMGAQNYGISACWFNPRLEKNPYRLKPNYTIRNLPEVLTLKSDRS